MAVRVEKSGAVTTVIHSRPAARNAMDPDSADALHAAFQDFAADANARVAVLFGEGGAFCAGWDLKYGASLAGQALPLRELDFPADGSEPPRGPLGPTRLALDKPVIAAVAGAAVAGGMELALWCDIRVMEEDAYLGVYCRRWGIPLLDGGTVRLPRLVGLGRAMEIVLTGRQVMAEECLRIGACERVVPTGRARQEAEALAHEIARFPPRCVRADRRSLYLQHGLSVREAMAAEWRNSIGVLDSEGLNGAAQFNGGAGRHGDYSKLKT
jgi:enoyl-CoA hydratase